MGLQGTKARGKVAHMTPKIWKNWGRPKSAPKTKKSQFLAPNRWFINKKWLVEHHLVCSVRVIRGRGAASLPNRKKWQICCRFCGNWVLIKIYTFKFKSKRTIPTSKRALSDGNVGLTRLWVYKGQKLRSKLHIWRQKCEKSEVSLKASEDQKITVFSLKSMIYK